MTAETHRQPAGFIWGRMRVDFQEKFEALIEAHPNGSKNRAELFHELLGFSPALTEEETQDALPSSYIRPLFSKTGTRGHTQRTI